MRIVNVICCLALLTLAGNSPPSIATVDPTSDFDCAALLKFYHRVLVPDGPADLQEETLVVNAWFTAKWALDAQPDDAKLREHYVAMVKAIGADPKAYRDQLLACSTRANADPQFKRFVSQFQPNPPAGR